MAADGTRYTLSAAVRIDLATGKPRPSWVEAGCREWIRLHPTCAATGGRDKLNAHHLLCWSWPGGDARANSDPHAVPPVFLTLSEDFAGCNMHLLIGHLGDYKSRNPDAVKDAAAFLAKVKARPYPKAT